LGDLKSLYRFKEERFTSFQHSVRIYIHGVDVSPWLKGEISVSYANRDGHNALSLTLANPRGLWQLNGRNLGMDPANGNKSEFSGKNEFNESAKAEIFSYKSDAKLNPSFPLDVTQTAFADTKKGTSTNQNVSALAGKSPFFPAATFEENRYRLALNDCIFNKNDYTRAFIANPLAPLGDQWMEIFCGFIQEHPITTNYINGESSVRISATCIKQQLTKMRVQVNTHLADLDPQSVIEDGFYADFIFPSINSHPFAQSSLEDTIKTLILGTSLPNSDKTSPSDLKKKVGDFHIGNVVCYDPSNPGNVLERWHLMSMFGVNKVPFPTGGAADDMWLTYREMQAIGKATKPGQDGTVGTPVSRYLHFLLPATGTGAHSLTTYNIMGGGIAQARDWTNRWEVIRDFASKLDFQVLTSPSGDILVEFPQYGFTPCAYMNSFGSKKAIGSTDTAALASHKVSQSTSLKGNNKAVDPAKAFAQCADTKNTLASLFVFDRFEKEGTLNDEAEDFPTVLQVSGGMAFSASNTGAIDVLHPRAYIFSKQLVSRYGVISESVDYPYAGQRPEDIGGSGSPLVRRMAQLGLIEYTKRMANASTWQGSLVYRPFLLPNRPIELKRSARIGNITSVTHTWHVGKDAITAVVTNQLMAKRPDGSYRLLTGAINTPIDYAAIWGKETEESSKGFNKESKEFIPKAPISGVEANTGTSKQSDQKVKEESNKPKPSSFTSLLSESGSTELSALFPPFRRKVAQMIAYANDTLKLDAKVTSTFRSGGKQRDMINSGKFPVIGEPYLSMHQYGLAVDITIAGHEEPQDRELKILNEANIKSGPPYLVWGGNFSSYDGVHFEVPYDWMNVRKARAILDLFVGQGMSEAEGIQQIWHAIYAHVPGNDQDLLVPKADNLESVVASADVDAPVKFLVPAACDDNKLLKKPGLKVRV